MNFREELWGFVYVELIQEYEYQILWSLSQLCYQANVLSTIGDSLLSVLSNRNRGEPV